MDPVDSAQKKSIQTRNPLQTESDALAHLRLCEDAITEVLLDFYRTGRPTPETEKKLRSLSNTRVTQGVKIQDSATAEASDTRSIR